MNNDCLYFKTYDGKKQTIFFSTFITNKTFNFQIRNEKKIYLNNISARTFSFST